MAEHALLSIKELHEKMLSSEKGLTQKEASKRLEQYGPNELPKGESSSIIKIFLQQFKDFLILLLLVATVLSLVLGEYIDAIAMFAIVLLSAILGFIQEYRATKAVEALKQISAPTARIIRNGQVYRVPAKELVPGDLLLLEEGDIVPADARLIEVSSLKANEASLTGESLPSEKHNNKCNKNEHITDMKNMVFMGTIIAYGKGKAIITHTGATSELGQIATSLETTEKTTTPLQLKFEKLAKQIGFAVIFLILIIFLVSFLGGSIPLTDMIIISLSLAVAAVPSSLPAIVTIGLSMGTSTLAKKNMIIKSLPAAESLGSATIICSDKTGTLTKNEMTITKLYTNNKLLDVTGTGYNPTGKILHENKAVTKKDIEKILTIGELCNNAILKKEKKWKIFGDPTEGSLLVLAKKAKISTSAYKILKEHPFDSDRKRMCVITQKGSKKEVLVKGAPDLLLEKCTKIEVNGKIKKITKKDKENILNQNKDFANQALRVLGMAYKPTTKILDQKEAEKDLIFIGLVGMIDPPKSGVKEAITDCRSAGIEVMMITGDHPITAKAVASKIGLYKEGDLVLTGKDISEMSEKKLLSIIKDVRIIARALPIQKSTIVDILKKKGHIVAMTGDGVNDAPALKKADIGIAMGVTGTDVAKEVAKATLADDNFTTIVTAIKEGRNIYDKILKSTRYLLACNMGEIVSVFLAIVLQFPIPLIPLQILLMNLLTDGLPALALSAEKSDEGIMQRKPRDPKEPPLTMPTYLLIISLGIVMGLGTLFMFIQYLPQGIVKAQTIAFTTLVMFEMFAVLGSRSLKPFSKMNPFTNKYLTLAIISSISIQIALIYTPLLQIPFGTTPLNMMDWLGIILISSLGYIVMEGSKFIGHQQAIKV